MASSSPHLTQHDRSQRCASQTDGHADPWSLAERTLTARLEDIARGALVRRRSLLGVYRRVGQVILVGLWYRGKRRTPNERVGVVDEARGFRRERFGQDRGGRQDGQEDAGGFHRDEFSRRGSPGPLRGPRKRWKGDVEEGTGGI